MKKTAYPRFPGARVQQAIDQDPILSSGHAPVNPSPFRMEEDAKGVHFVDGFINLKSLGKTAMRGRPLECQPTSGRMSISGFPQEGRCRLPLLISKPRPCWAFRLPSPGLFARFRPRYRNDLPHPTSCESFSTAPFWRPQFRLWMLGFVIFQHGGRFGQISGRHYESLKILVK